MVWYTLYNLSIVTPSELDLSGPREGTCTSFSYRFVFVSMGDKCFIAKKGLSLNNLICE